MKKVEVVKGIYLEKCLLWAIFIKKITQILNNENRYYYYLTLFKNNRSIHGKK